MHRYHLLDDDAVARFIATGYHLVQPNIDAAVLADICTLTRQAAKEGSNPGNAIYDRVPPLQEVFSHPQIVGALTSLLGPGYRMECHRHLHLTQPGSVMGGFHQDGTPRAFKGWNRPWRRWHRPRKVIAVFFPHAVPLAMGPTSLIPGSHYYDRRPDGLEKLEMPLTSPAGTLALAHHAIWHRARANGSDQERIMLKFIFNRATEPHQSHWQHKADFTPDFGALSQGPLQRLPRAWSHTWDWLSGISDSSAAAEEGPWRELLADLDADDEATAIEAAYRLGTHMDPSLADLLCTHLTEPEYRETAARALSTGGPTAATALARVLDQQDPWSRATAADLLGDLGHDGLVALPQITQALDDPDPWVRHNAVQTLEIWGQGALPTEDRLIQALGDEHPFVRFNAISALVNLRPQSQHYLPLLKQLADRDTGMQQWKAADTVRQLQYA